MTQVWKVSAPKEDWGHLYFKDGVCFRATLRVMHWARGHSLLHVQRWAKTHNIKMVLLNEYK